MGQEKSAMASQRTTLLWVIAGAAMLLGGIAIADYQQVHSQQPSDSHPSETAPQPDPRGHAYVFEQNGMYGYSVALSDQDIQQGIATKPLLMIRYLGILRNQQHWVAIQGLSNQTEFLCAPPCKYVTSMSYSFMGATGAQQVTEVVPGSVLEAVVGDINAGYLKPSSLNPG